MKSPRKVLVAIVAAVVAIAAVGWALSTQLRSPADEAARRTPPKASLITAAVERRELVSSVVLNGALEYGSPLPISLAGVVGGTTGAEAGGGIQRATRAPRKGRIREGAVLMEVNGRPVFVLRGKVPMHRTLVPGTKGDDIEQLQAALRRLGFGAPRSGVFDQGTIAAVGRMYARRGYEAQQPALAERQNADALRKAVQSAQEGLATERKALDEGRDIQPLKIKLDNAKSDLRTAESALEEAESRRTTPEDETRTEAAAAAVRAAEEKLLEAEQQLDAARRPPAQPSSTPTATSAPDPAPTTDTSLQEMRVANARAELDTARRAYERLEEEARQNRTTRLRELRKSVRAAQEALFAAEQGLRQARNLSPTRLKVANAQKDVAAAKALLAEFLRTYGVSIPPGELVFLPTLPVRVNKTTVKAGQPVDKDVATVTSSTFAVSGTLEAAEADLLRPGMSASIELETGRTYPAVLTAVGEKAKLAGQAKAEAGDQAVLITPTSMKGLKGLAGTTVTARVTVGSTDEPVLVVPVAAVITSADGKARVKVERTADKTEDVEVRTGLTADGNVQVSGQGLNEGDRVVVSGA
ncbi:peptidoglycan-binding protein [Nonomuraea longicatena]|uniref:Multidrug resistance protein MdtA-like C-terminal permuted SH3 domain-containing protein n=1 Tax=Nonomuraea longicatena TaxID=83682 RepID=A0ABN1QYS9_9ACTN